MYAIGTKHVFQDGYSIRMTPFFFTEFFLSRYQEDSSDTLHDDMK